MQEANRKKSTKRKGTRTTTVKFANIPPDHIEVRVESFRKVLRGIVDRSPHILTD